MIHFLISKKYIRIKGEKRMNKKRHSVETIVSKLREAEVLLGRGQTLAEVLRQLGISDATYYKWRKE